MTTPHNKERNPLIIQYQESVRKLNDLRMKVDDYCEGEGEYAHKGAEVGYKHFLLTRFLSSVESEIERGKTMERNIDYQPDMQDTHSMSAWSVEMGYNSALTSFLAPYYEAREWAKGELLSNK